jgi:hypothetical protein
MRIANRAQPFVAVPTVRCSLLSSFGWLCLGAGISGLVLRGRYPQATWIQGASYGAMAAGVAILGVGSCCRPERPRPVLLHAALPVKDWAQHLARRFMELPKPDEATESERAYFAQQIMLKLATTPDKTTQDKQDQRRLRVMAQCVAPDEASGSIDDASTLLAHLAWVEGVRATSWQGDDVKALKDLHPMALFAQGIWDCGDIRNRCPSLSS